MYLNEIKGSFKIDDKEYFITSSVHASDNRGNAELARDKVITFSLIKKIFKNINIPTGKFVVTWKYKDFYDGILFVHKNNYIKIITAIIGQKKKSPDVLFKDITVRFDLEDISKL